MNIDRCQCFGRTFLELKQIAAETGATSVQELQQAVPFGKRCRLCVPYVRRMMKTGEVVFHTILTEESPPVEGE